MAGVGASSLGPRDGTRFRMGCFMHCRAGCFMRYRAGCFVRFSAGRFVHWRPRGLAWLGPGCSRPLDFRPRCMWGGFVWEGAWLGMDGGAAFCMWRSLRPHSRPGFWPAHFARAGNASWTPGLLRTRSLWTTRLGTTRLWTTRLWTTRIWTRRRSAWARDNFRAAGTRFARTPKVLRMRPGFAERGQAMSRLRFAGPRSLAWAKGG
jgi:hypothetical protein